MATEAITDCCTVLYEHVAGALGQSSALGFLWTIHPFMVRGWCDQIYSAGFGPSATLNLAVHLLHHYSMLASSRSM